MSRESEIAMEHAIAPSDLGKKTGLACTQHTTSLLYWPTVCTSHVAGKKVTRWRTGCAPNSNSCTTTRNRNVLPNNHDALNASLNRKDNL